MKRAEVVLAAGLAATALGAGLCEFVLIGLIGVGLLLLAVVLLASVVLIEKARVRVSRWRRAAGLVLYVAGASLLLVVAGAASSLAFDQATGAPPIGSTTRATSWMLTGAFSVLAALLIAIGLRLWAQWTARRALIWGLAALGVMPLAVLIFKALAPILPLTT